MYKNVSVDLRFVTYGEGDAMLKRNEGWQLATRYEDTNRTLGWVYLHRIERHKRFPSIAHQKGTDGKGNDQNPTQPQSTPGN